MDSHDVELLKHLGGDISGKTDKEQEEEFVRVLRKKCIEMGADSEKINAMDLLHLKITRLQMSHIAKGKDKSATDGRNSPTSDKPGLLVESPSQESTASAVTVTLDPKVLRMKGDVPSNSSAGKKTPSELGLAFVGQLETKEDSSDEGGEPAAQKTGTTVLKKFRMFRSSSNHADKNSGAELAQPPQINFSPISNMGSSMSTDDTEEGLMRTLVRYRRKKKMLTARLESLRVQEGLTFALENQLDAKKIHDVREDLKVACTNIRTPFLTKSGPLLPVLRALRLRREEIEWIRGINEMGWQAYLEYMQQMEEDSIMELNAVQEEYARNRKMIAEEKAKEEEAANGGKKSKVLSAKFGIDDVLSKLEAGQANADAPDVFAAPPPSFAARRKKNKKKKK